MGYYIDLETISIEKYKTKLESAYLPPSRMILKENLDERFNYFKSIGINNVKELLQILKKNDKLEDLSKANCLSENYLKILLRELNSTLPKPNKIKEFVGISEGTILKLEKIGIKNTFKLFDNVVNDKKRKEFAKLSGVSDVDILELTKLTDLSRIKWVGVTFARMLYDLEIDTVEKASKSDPVDLHKRINQINKEKKFYKGQIGLNDIKIFVDAAKEIPLDIKY
ncbi:MAG: DUF4332 domain-containing protein [Bacteroidales bacterium]|nr:DUF4332 domain-containing protein [Bacteroidales bacterium]